MRLQSYLAILAMLLPVVAGAQPEPTYDHDHPNSSPTYTKDNVWHLNMELICPYSGGGTPGLEYGQAVTVGSNEYIISHDYSTGELLLVTVTDPRTPSIALRVSAGSTYAIYNESHEQTGTYKQTNADLGGTLVWKDNTSGGALEGHLLAFCYVSTLSGTNGLVLDEHNNTFGVLETNDNNGVAKRAEFIVVDLTAALSLTTTSNKTIDLDLTDRDYSQRHGVPSTATGTVYLGYLEVGSRGLYYYGSAADCFPKRDISKFHNMTVDAQSGIVMLNTLDSTMPLIRLSTVATDPNLGSSSLFVHPHTVSIKSPTLTFCDNTTGILVGSAPMFRVYLGGQRAEINNHEAHCEPTRVIDEVTNLPTSTLISNKINLWSASFARNSANPAGGAVVLQIDYSDDENAGVTLVQYHATDLDRRSPTKKEADDASWKWQPLHTVMPLRVDTYNELFLTSSETPGSYHYMDPNATFNPVGGRDMSTHLIPHTDWNSETYLSSFIYPIQWDGNPASTNEDHRRNAHYLRLFESSDNQLMLQGYTGSSTRNGDREYNDASAGPIGAYDVPEQTSSDRASGTHGAVTTVSGISVSDCSVERPSRAPNTIHHYHTVFGDKGTVPTDASKWEVFISYYSQGARVIDLSDFNHSGSRPTTNTYHAVKEKAYFDLMPTLSYDTNSRFFYAASGTPLNNVDDYFASVIAVRNYYGGMEDVMPDLGRTQSDENFVYGYSSTDASKDPQGPWAAQKRIYILRYFRDKIGGTITGYTPGSGSGDMAFREVNLQGTFEVARPTTIADGATVHLLDGTQLTPNSTNGITVNGILSVETMGETGRGYADVPIHVTSTGKLIVKAGAHFDFKKSVTVDAGGEFTIAEDTRVVFGNSLNWINGKFTVLGTSSSHKAEIDGALSTDRSSVTGQTVLLMGGNGVATSSLLRVNYAAFTNVEISATNISLYSPAIDHSTFYHNVAVATTYPSGCLVSLRRSLPLDPAYKSARVQNTTFSTAGSGAEKRAGLSITGKYRDGRVTACTFSNLDYAGYIDNPLHSYFTSNTVTDCRQGLTASMTRAVFCSNSVTNADFGLTGWWDGYTTYSFNSSDNVHSAFVPFRGGVHTFRGNTLEDYWTGLYGVGAQLVLTNVPSPPGSEPPWGVYGRNHFAVSTGLFAYDVMMDPQCKIYVKCGYNQFSLNSIYHIYGTGSLDASNNDWLDPTHSNGWPRVNSTMSWTGSPLNQSANLTQTCYGITSSSECGLQDPIRDGGRWEGIESSTSEIQSALLSAEAAAQDTTIAVGQRQIALGDAFTAVRIIDSTGRYQQLRDVCTNIVDATSGAVPAQMKSFALLTKGMVQEILGDSTQALTTYGTVVSTYATTADSIPAAWRLRYFSAAADAVNPDSAFGTYYKRIYDDLKRVALYQPPSPKRANGDPSVEGFELGELRPNPTDKSAVISIQLPEAVPVVITIFDLSGNIAVASKTISYPKGSSEMEIRTDGLAVGNYVVRLDALGQSWSRKIQVSR